MSQICATPILTHTLAFRYEHACGFKVLSGFFILFKEQFEKDSTYELSFWYYNHLYDQTYTRVSIQIKDRKGKVYFIKQFPSVNSAIYDGDWALNVLQFKLQDPNDEVLVTTSGRAVYADSIYIDELLIRPANLNIYKPVESPFDSLKMVIKNNENIPYK